MDKAAIFIDGAYLEEVLQNKFNNARIDFEKLVKALSPDMPVLRTYYYNCEPYQSNPPTEAEKRRLSSVQKFHHYLRRLPNFEVRLGHLALRGRKENGDPNYIQKGVDVFLAVEMIRLSIRRSISKVILVAGDSDLVPAVIVAKEEGVQVVLVHSDWDVTYQQLVTEADQTILMDDNFIDPLRINHF